MNKKANFSSAKLVFEELEPRLLLSADGLGVITEASVATLQTLVHSENENIIIVQHQTEQSSTVIHNKVQNDSRSELVIIDSRAPNFQQLHNDVIKAQQQGRDINVVILDAHRDGIEQISDALSKYNKLDAVHIVSHGKDGQLQLGATQLNNQNLKQNNEEINKWKQVFTEGGDLLIYGCNLAGTSNGTDLVNSLSDLTGTDVAASDDVTGNNVLGGDWDLEYQVGDIETSIAFTADIQDNWQGTLNADALAAEQAAVEEQQQQEQVQAEQEAALIAESEAVLLAEEKEAEAIAQEPEQQAGIVEEQRQEIIFIDEYVDDYQTFIDDLNNNNNGSINFEVVLLDSNRDGIEQISETLSTYDDVDAVHILSHGKDGSVKLGNTWLSTNNLDEYSDSIYAWGSSLDENADILIYGCNLAESESGEQFVSDLAQLSSADVAASDDLTGHESLGGDWDLEYQVGEIDAGVAPSAELQVRYQHILAIINGTAGDDVLVGTAASDVISAGAGNDVLVSGGGSDQLLGEADDDIFHFTGAQDGDVYTVDGGTGTDTIDLSGYASTAVTFGDGTMTIDMGGGQSFSIDYTLVNQIAFSDITATVLTGSTSASGWSGTGLWIDVDEAFKVDMSGAGTIDIDYDTGSDTFSVTGSTGVGATSSLTITDLNGTDLLVDQITLDSSFGDLTTNTGVGSIILAGAGSDLDGAFTIGGDLGSITVDKLDGMLDVIGDIGTLTIGNELDGEVDIDGGVDTVDITGKIGSGGILSIGGDAGYIHVSSDIVASADVSITGNVTTFAVDDRILGSVDIGGDVGTFELTGLADGQSDITAGSSVTIGGDVTTLTVQGNIKADVVPLLSVDGSVGTMTVSGNVLSDVTIGGDLDSASMNSVDPSAKITANHVVGTLVFDVGGSDHGGTYATPVVYVFDGSTQTASVTLRPIGSNDSYSVNEDTTLSVDWWNTDWTARQQLTFNNLDQTENLAEFPVLIKLNASNIDYAKTQNNGDDLRFVDGDGTVLAHEIEGTWTKSGTNYVWVKVPQIDGSSGSDFIWMYYGNDLAGSVENPAGVWASDYLGVWHLGEEQSGTGTNGVYQDSTSPTYHGDDEVSATGQDGQIGGGQQFDGTDDFIDLWDSGIANEAYTAFTFSAWYKSDDGTIGGSGGSDDEVIFFADSEAGGSPGVWPFINFSITKDAGHEGQVHLEVTEDWFGTWGEAYSTTNVVDQDWHHVAAVRTGGAGSMLKIYVDGVEEASIADASGGGLLDLAPGTYQEFYIGAYEWNGSGYTDGFLDEVSVSNAERTADWIAAEYLSMTDTFVTFGGEENAPIYSNVLANDSASDGDSLSAVLVAGPSNAASFTLNQDGSFTYTPITDFNGVDSFTYKANDGTSDSNIATVNITVNAANDAPTFFDGAVGSWSFNEGSGDSVAEGAVGISTATLGSTTGADANDPTWTSGIFGQALHFDGVNDYVEIADAPGIDISGPEFSASLWVKPDRGPGTEDMFFMKGDRQGIGNVNYYLSWKDTGKMTWAFKSDGGFEYLDMDVTLPTVGEWNHVAVIFDRPTVSIYINGTEYTSSVGTGGTSMDKDLVANNEPLWIGAGRDGGSIVTPGNFSAPFSGAIDELALFDRALTGAEVEAIRTSTPPVVTASAFSINENSANNTLVGTVVANDQDVGDTLSYAITAGNTGGAFSIDGNGQITVADSAALDFETNPVFNLTIEATDDGTPAKSDTASVSISLNDVNDAPVARPDGVHLSFDGDDFVEVADHASLQMTNEVSMEARIKHDGTGTGSQIIVNKEGEYELGITANTGEIKFAIARSDNTWAWHNTGYFVTAGEWTHVAVTYDGISGEARTYINGELVDAYSQSGSIGDVYVGLNNLWIGGRENDPLDRFEGQIDEVRVWNTTRTLGEIQANKDGQLGGAEAGLVGNWRLDDAAGGAVIDQSSFGNDGILGGSEGAAATPSYQGYVTDQNTVLNIAAGDGVLANDSDVDSGSLTVTNLDTTGMLGNLVLNTADGSFSYNPNGAFDYLAAGEQATETFSYTANDGSLDSNTVTATITITGVNDAPVIGGVDTGSVTEDVDPDLDTLLETSGVLTIADPDTGESSFVAETITGTYGNLAIDTAGNWSYGSDKTQAAIQALGVGETLIDALIVTTADGSTHKVVITINGAADAPVANNDSYTINEDSTLTTNDWHLSSADWPYRQQITFDNSAQTENLTDFAVLVKLDATRIDYTHTQNNGEDLRFFDADGTLLDYEIEKWDEAGASYVWVRVPQIDASSNIDNIWMYYGNSSATSGETPANVWDSNYVGVWHLGEEQAGTANTGLYKDSTSYNNDGTDNVAATGQDGSLGDGQQFSGAGDSIDIAHSDELNLTDAMTLSFWVNPSEASGNFNRVIEKGAFGYQDSYYFGGGAGTNDLGFYLNWDGNPQPVIDTADNVLSVGTWQQATVTLTSAGDATLFLNGAIIGTGTYSGGAFAGNTDDLHISFANSTYDFAGGIDEVRISNTARSSDWVAAEYLTMTDSFASFGGEETTVLPDGVCANDTDGEGDPLTVNTTPIIDVSNGALTLNDDGTFTYTPDANYNGTDSFTYEVSDGNGGTHQATVTITVTAINDAPTGADKTITATEDTDYVFTAADFGFIDTSDSPANNFLNVIIASAPTNGTLYLDANGDGIVDGGETLIASSVISVVDITAGKLKFKPAANANAVAYDSFTFQVQDDGGAANSGADIDQTANTITIDVTAVNDAGTFAGNVSATTNEDTATAGTVTFNDAADSFTTPNFSINTAATNGTAAIDAAGNWTYTPTANYNGADSFTVQVTDDDGNVETQVISITVTQINDAGSFAGNVSATTNEDTATAGTVTFTDAVDGFTTPNFSLNTAASNGVAAIDAAGNWTYTPTANYNGADSFTVQVTDDDGNVETQVISITVTGVNDAGTFAGNVSATTNEDTATAGTVTFTDTADGFTTPNFSLNTAASNGVAAIDAAGNWTYTPTANFNGSDSFTVQVTDDDGNVETQVVLITVTQINDAGTFGGNVSATTNEDTATAGTVTFSDTVDGFTTPNFSINTAASNGVAAIDAVGNWTYTPTANYNGADSFTVQVTDDDGNVETQVITITVTGVNNAGTFGGNVSATTNEDTATAGTVTFTDAVDGFTTPNFTINAAASNGVAAIDAAGNWTYTPTANFNGSDSFTVQVTDDDGNVETQVISLTVTPINDAGTFGGNVSATTNEDTATAGTVTFNDAVDGFTTPNFSINTAATNGVAAINAAGNWTYTPSSNYNGADSFTVQVTDDDGNVETQVVLITVTQINNAGTFAGDTTATTDEDTATAGTVTFTDAVDGFTTPNFSLNTAASNGVAAIDAAGNWTYTPTANYNGADSFTVQVTDDDGNVETQVITITVTGVNNAGTFGGNVSATTNEDTATAGTVTFSDTADGFTTPNFSINTAATNGVAAINAAGNWTYTPSVITTVQIASRYRSPMMMAMWKPR